MTDANVLYLGASGNFVPVAAGDYVVVGDGLKSAAGVIDIPNGETLSFSGTGMIDLPALFKIATVAVSANVTAANLNTLTGGGSTTLHTHAGIGGPSTMVRQADSGGAGVAVGAVVYSLDDGGTAAVDNADPTAVGTADAVGICLTAAAAGADTTVAVAGDVPVPASQFTGALAAGDVGKKVYVSATTPGKLSLAQVGSNNFSKKVGILSEYGAVTCYVSLQPGEVVGPLP